MSNDEYEEWISINKLNETAYTMQNITLYTN
jgi:hypothetical protein